MKMKDSVVKFMRENGFYLSFGVGVIALVAALAVYNVNTSRKSQQNQEINLNEPLEQDFADAKDTSEDIQVQETIQDGDLDVPMDMWKTEEAVEPEKSVAAEEANTENTEAAAVISNQTVGYAPIDGLEFHGIEAVTMPVLGNTILPYSMDTTVYFKTLGTYRCNPGMLLQAPVGTDVASIWHGQVVKVEDSREYGTVVSVNLGSGYIAEYGQLQDVRVAVGDEVFQDTILGTVAEPTAYYQMEGSHLYFAMTKDDQPINPMEVLQVE